jgi:hypothetical protein
MSTPASRKKATRKSTPARATEKKAAAPKGAASTKRNANGTNGLKIRMYRVGFGDFFLVIVPTSSGDRYILIDCGVFKGTTGKGDIGSIEEAVEDLFQTTKGQLALVIMTHRHADHIAGFSRAAERFKDFKVSLVWMPYWEQFNDSKDSPSNLQLNIEQVALQLALQFRGRDDGTAKVALAQLGNATGFDFNAAGNGAKRGGGNAAALDLLKNHFGNNGKNVRYYAAGDKAELPPELEGLTAEILGPPPKGAKAFVALTDLKKGVGQYLDSTTASDTGAKAIHPFPPYWSADLQKDYPARDGDRFSIDYKSVGMMVDGAQPDMLAAAAAKIDTFLNNQSLVVLFKFAGKSLLFVGDAQAGNWENWLYKIEAPAQDPSKASLTMTPESQQILEGIDFYKVGHHGSTNATPIAVVDALSKNHTANGFVAMCSTQSDVYGNPDKGTEVPREPLMKALGDECTLVRSDSIDITTSGGTVKANPDVAKASKPRAGALTTGKLYIEYSF